MFRLFEKWGIKKQPPLPFNTILVIEDNQLDRTFIQKVFKRQNFNILTAGDAETGLSIARKEKIDLIILDYLLPGMNGLEICQILKEGENTSNIPIIFLSVIQDGYVLIRCFEAGAEGFMSKPVTARQLLNEVKLILLEKKEGSGAG